MRSCEAETRAAAEMTAAATATAGSSDDDDDDDSGSDFVPSPYSRATLSLVTIDDFAASAPADTAFLLTPEVEVRKRSFSAPHRPAAAAGSPDLQGTVEEPGDKGKRIDRGRSGESKNESRSANPS